MRTGCLGVVRVNALRQWSTRRTSLESPSNSCASISALFATEYPRTFVSLGVITYAKSVTDCQKFTLVRKGLPVPISEDCLTSPIRTYRLVRPTAGLAPVFLGGTFALFVGCSESPTTPNGTSVVAGGAANTGGTAVTAPTGGTTGKGGTQSQGGLSAAGGSVGSGGSSPGSGGNASGGVVTATGGQIVGGATQTGGARSAGGANATGGAANTGGTVTTGGKSSTGGAAASGGSSNTGGSVATGGSRATGGTTTTGGTSTTGGAAAAGSSSGTTGPCDIYQAGATPCVAAHSTTRALYGAYTGNLYQIRRASDKTTKDIGVSSPGGYADSAVQVTFCANTTCTVSIIYDQSPQKNHLTLTSGGWIGTRAKEADAFGIKVTLNGHTVYGIHVPLSTDRVTGVGYRNNTATGTAEGDAPESMYMVANGKAFSNECCFDYGNAERNSLNNGSGTMEAIYFGNCTTWGYGEGSGPWVMADLENGLFSGKNAKLNSANKSITSAFVTAMIKGKPHTFAVKAGDSQAGALVTMYEGAYPSASYDPMKKEGAIVLGTGGDNSFMGAGDFFEGVMTSGYATDATDNAVQANIVAAGYGK